MANIRIKDLSTTAAVTASDDFIAVDGATNGTRKLDAYSPTFGGNLTVSGGTIGTAASTNLTLAGGSSGASLVLSSGNANSLLTAKGPTSSAILTLHNSRTTETNIGLAITNAYPNAASRNWAFAINNSAFGDLAILQSNALGGDAFTAGTSALYISPARNLLLGTTTDSSNGKLQLATHTTSAGGIGFGTDTTLSRATNAGWMILGTTGTSSLFFLQGGGSGVYFNSTGSNFATGIIEGSGSLLLRTGNTTALTLDSSQNATFAGTTVKISNAASPQLNFNNVGVRDWYAGVQTANDRLVFGTSVSSSGGHAIRIDSSLNVYVPNGELVLTNALKLGNAYTAGAPTATGYVTIKDSAGNTYKVLVGT